MELKTIKDIFYLKIDFERVTKSYSDLNTKDLRSIYSDSRYFEYATIKIIL